MQRNGVAGADGMGWNEWNGMEWNDVEIQETLPKGRIGELCCVEEEDGQAMECSMRSF